MKKGIYLLLALLLFAVSSIGLAIGKERFFHLTNNKQKSINLVQTKEKQQSNKKVSSSSTSQTKDQLDEFSKRKGEVFQADILSDNETLEGKQHILENKMKSVTSAEVKTNSTNTVMNKPVETKNAVVQKTTPTKVAVQTTTQKVKPKPVVQSQKPSASTLPSSDFDLGSVGSGPVTAIATFTIQQQGKEVHANKTYYFLAEVTDAQIDSRINSDIDGLVDKYNAYVHMCYVFTR